MAKTRARRDELPPPPDQLVLRGVLAGTWLDSADLRQAAIIDQELYGFYGISVWVTSTSHPRELLESTKLIKFERYAEFTVADLCRARVGTVGYRAAAPLRCDLRRQRPGVPRRAAGWRSAPDPGQPQRRPGGALR
jgi:hypothetical protein